MKRICFFSGDITRSGGTEKVACQIMNGLANYYKIYVLSLTEENKDVFFFLDEKIKRCCLFQSNPNGIRYYISIVKEVRKYLKKNKIDIFIDIDSILDIFSVVAVSFTKIKLISWEHFNFYETMENKLRVPIRKYVTRYTDCVVTLTKEDQQNYKDYFGSKLLIKQIYNPIEIIRFDNQYELNSKTIISVGRLAKQKGFDYLLNVAKKVFDKYPDWQWIILGEGDERSILEKVIKEEKLKQVKLLGRVNNVGDYLKKSAIFVMTSRYEGFPLVLIEAKQYNLPIVSFKCKTGPSELVKDKVNGYLVECFDIDEMANKICELIKSNGMRLDFSNNAKIDIDSLEYKNIIKKWKILLDEL